MEHLQTKFPLEFFSYLRENSLIDIKGGNSYPKFLDIWIVHGSERVFARSWNKSERSWFTEFVKTGIGQIRYGNKILNVKGIKVDRDDPIQTKINLAYLERFTAKETLVYAEGIAKEEYFDYTMEFFYQP